MSPSARPRPAERSALEGPLDWRRLVEWLSEDGVISAEEARRTIARCAQAESAQHPLVRLAAVAMTRAGDGKPLDIEALTQYLAGRAGLEYLRIDPLKVDVGRVADAMSAAYAERHRVLPVQVATQEVVVATAEPFITDWVAEVERQAKRPVRRVVANPKDIQRYTAEFFALAKSVRAAQRSGGSAGGGQLRAAGGAGQEQQAARRQRPGRGAGGRLAVDLRVRPARERHPPGAAARAGRDPLPHRRRAAPGLPDAHGRAQRHDRAHQAARAHGRGRKAPPAGRPHQDPQRPRRRSRDAPVDAAHRVRREDGDAHLRPRHRGQGPGRAGLLAARRAALGSAGQAPARHRAGHRPDRLGQDHHAVLHAQARGHRGGERQHGGGPDRDDRAGLQPDAGAAAARLRLRRGPARADAAGPGHHHGRRDPRPGDGRDGGAGGAHRPPGVLARCTPTTRPRPSRA